LIEEAQKRPKFHDSFPKKSDIAMDFQIKVLINRQAIVHASHNSINPCKSTLVDKFDICRTWNPRRLILTNEIIAFAKTNEDMLFDAIPLTDVIGIELMQGVGQKGKVKLQRSFSEITVENVIDFNNAFQIRTKQDGYNSGRKYIVQADSDATLSSLTIVIPNFSKAAVLRADARPMWRRMQERVRALYSSSPFQGIASFLIMAVRINLAPRARSTPPPDRHARCRTSASQSSRRSCRASSSPTPTAR
jgi:hypothetical protein